MSRVTGILLAAGAAVRFGGAKLLARLPDGERVGVRAASNLIAVLPETIAVVRPGDDVLAAALAAAGAGVTICRTAGAGMGSSLAHGIGMAGDCDGYVVALADMPWIAATSITAVVDALEAGAAIAVPRYHGQRGHPVGFGRAYRSQLVALTGDAGARSILADAPHVQWIDVDDPGVVRDIDVAADLR